MTRVELAILFLCSLVSALGAGALFLICLRGCR